MKNNLILEAIKTAIVDGKASVSFKEASTLASSGSGIGGRVIFDDAFATLRYVNPLRNLYRIIPVSGSDAQFVAKVGNATNATNPWGYGINSNNGSVNIATSIWQLPVRDLNATLPIRTAAMADINNIDPAIVGDLMAEFSALEGAAMIQNNDQSGTSTTTFGGTSGPRGLAAYPASTSAAAYGSSGAAITNGLHTILRSNMPGSSIAYNDVVTLSTVLPPQYWHLPGTAWMMHPLTLQTMRELKDSSGLPMFLELGMNETKSFESLWGWPIVTNPNMDYVAGTTIVGTRFMYLAHWPSFFTIGDTEEMDIQRLDQTAPGFITLYGEKRVLSTVRDPFAGVVLGTA